MADKGLEGAVFFCSWSGGKDSCLALHRARAAGMKPKALLTMMTEQGDRSRSHGLTADVLERQAASLGLPLVLRAATWDDYEEVFVEALEAFRAEGMHAGVFGDIDLEPHRAWVEQVCERAKLQAVEPLWQEPRPALLREFLDAGFQARIVAVNLKKLSARILGQPLDPGQVAALRAAGVDASGELGEYHTVVTAGPGFSVPLRLEAREIVTRDGYGFIDLAITEGSSGS